ncbi:uncharacterized protein LOC119367742 [Triticum dicoccoides]|uniref:Uncharacterized protein n=1 Tax=Triticum turgidum subsp. durum TaxID=4567 RepID=A0A9R1RLV0_TRITD|nr:uncharacterized protein LOC119367742 [Triticum dicoccoides]VAH46445.1 unnamed protein product [Triticum turgidum subsp. durum]
MGLCMSSGGAAAAVRAEGEPASTAMVLMPTGELREYPRPATAAEALEDNSVAGDAGWFLCDADAMGFEGPVAAVAGAEELRPGQIYFVLPAEARKNGLRREDLAALAVRASAALVSKASANASGSAGRRRRAGSVSPLVFAQPPEVDGTLAYKTVPTLAAKRRPVARAKSAGRMQRFAPDLTAIPECE